MLGTLLYTYKGPLGATKQQASADADGDQLAQPEAAEAPTTPREACSMYAKKIMLAHEWVHQIRVVQILLRAVQ